MASTLPIAVMDTGAGGLSVVKAIRRVLPHENIQYFADTAHLPYGIKSPELINYLALKMAKRLVKLSSCKILVVACHTISVSCLKAIEEAVSVPVIGMVSPSLVGLKSLVATNAIKSVGIISTKATVNSRAYSKAWHMIDPFSQVQLIEHASGPLVSLVEEGDLSHNDQCVILNHFLPQSIKESDALLIGCTHFSALTPSLREVLKPTCHIVDAADFAAAQVVKTLEMSSGVSSIHYPSQLVVYVSDNKERFQNIARRFIEEELAIEVLRDYARTKD